MSTLFFVAAIFVGLVVLVVGLLVTLRKTEEQEAEMIRRQDEAMKKIKDDPHEPARFVR